MSTATEYRELLVRFLPHPIRSDVDYRRSLAQLERLMVPRPSAARSQFIEMLATLVERYESRDYPTPECDSADMLRNLLDAKGVSPATVAKATKIPPATISNVLARRRGISKANAVLLGKYFGVSATVFLDAGNHPLRSPTARSRMKKSSVNGKDPKGQGASAKAGGKSRMKESYKVRPSQPPWPRVMRSTGQPAGRSVHRGTAGLCIELRKHFFAEADPILSRGRQQ